MQNPSNKDKLLLWWLPIPEYLSQIHPKIDEVFLSTGIAITFLIAVIVYLYQKKFRSEKDLKHSEEGLKIAQGIAHIGNWEWNMVNNSEVWSDEQFRIFGYEPGMVVANYDLFQNALHPEDKERVLKAVRETLHNNAPYHVEFRIMRPTNEVRMVYAQGTVYRDNQDKPVRMIGTVTDITKRKQYEDELKRLNETLEQRVAERTNKILRQNEELVTLSKAVEQSSTCIVITDSNGTIEYVNPQFIELTGYTLEEAKGQNPRISQSGQTPPERFKELWDTITAGKTWHGEFINKKKNGEIYYELGTISPIKNTEGKITHFVAIKNDISETKRLEAERKRLEEQLYHAQKLESIGKLAGGIAHDFNNMLMAVVGYSNLIEMELKENDPLRSYTKKILGLTENGKRLTQSLLTFGRRQPLFLSTIDLNDVIRDMEALLFRAVGERIRCEMSLTGKSVAIKADSNKLEQVVMNLIVNAVEAMPNGGRLTIRTGDTELDRARAKSFGLGAAGAYALMSVSDTGIGMDEATKDLIFEPFFTTKARGKETGLGLSIAYGIVKQHNGAIEVISKPGEGATFNIYLPITSEKLKKGVAEALHLLPLSPPLLSKTILVAEDEEGVRETITMMLRQKGFRVIAAVDGEDAVNKFELNKGSIDLLLFDGIMPVKSGKEAYDSIKKMKPDIKALFMSGYSGDEESNKKIQEEGLRFLQKPVPLPELLDAIRKTLEA